MGHQTQAAAVCFVLYLAMIVSPVRGQSPTDPSTIPESEYVTVRDGHLSVDGQRRRFWAVIGKLYSDSGVTPNDSPAEHRAKVETARKSTDILLDRFEKLGFNSFRLWTAVPNTEAYTVGDGSSADSVDYFLAQA